MNDIEVRVECIKAAASTPGNPNHVQMAREYYAFATEQLVLERALDEAATRKPVKKGAAKN